VRQYAKALLLEEPIPVNYYLVGTREWLDSGVAPDAAPPEKRICVQSDRQLDAIRDELMVQKTLGWDSETTGSASRPKDGLDPLSKTSRLLMFQVGTEDKVFVMDPRLLKGKRIKQVMEAEHILHIGQNLIFDFEMLLAKYGIHPVNMFCTMLAEQLLTAGKDGEWPSLLDLCRKYPPHRLISKGIREQFAEHTGPLSRQQIYYAARDVVLPFPIARAQIQLIKELKLNQVARDEMDCIAATAEMELGGFILNQALIRLALPYYVAQAEALRQEILELWNEELDKRGQKQNMLLDVGLETFDLNSPQKKMQALHRIGIMVKSVSKGELEDYDQPICELLLKYEKQKKIISTYGESLLSKIHPDTGKFQPHFDQLGAGEDADADGRDKTATIATGRYSSDAQQMPKAKKIFAKVTDPAQLAICQQLFAEYKLKKAA
jgi:DNA polymerase I-like protein with 3'-5' exonuclease and polymerase domains